MIGEATCYSLINNIVCMGYRKISWNFSMNKFYFIFEMCPIWTLAGKQQRINFKTLQVIFNYIANFSLLIIYYILKSDI